MEYYEQYTSYLQTEGTGSAVLQKLYQEAAYSLANDPPELALTRTGQMAAAMLKVARDQDPLEQGMVNALNAVTEMMMAYLNKMGWRFRAYKTPEGWKYEYPPV